MGNKRSGIFFARAGTLQPRRFSALRANVIMFEAAHDFRNAAAIASNLSETELSCGSVGAAIAAAAKSVEYADRGGHEFQMMVGRAGHADALRAAGQAAKAEELFADAERRQRESLHNIRCSIPSEVISTAISCCRGASGQRALHRAEEISKVRLRAAELVGRVTRYPDTRSRNSRTRAHGRHGPQFTLEFGKGGTQHWSSPQSGRRWPTCRWNK